MQRVAQILRVVDETGQPLAGVTLAVLSAQGPVPDLGYRTGDDGRVQVGLPPGATTIEAILPDGKRLCLSLEAVDRAGHEHELRVI